MIVLYPILLACAIAIVLIRTRAGGRGWLGFAAWTGAGAFLTFSFLTGLSIGLLLLPLAAAALLATALAAPHLAESSGFVAGAGATALVVAAANWGDGEPGPTPLRWLLAGIGLIGTAVAGYAATRRQPRLIER